MRVLQLHNRQLDLGGVDEVIHRENHGLTGRGYEVDIYCEHTADYLEMGTARKAASVIWNNSAHRNVRRVLAENRYDIVHVHTPFPFLSGSVIHAAHSARVPVLMTVHSYRVSCVRGTFYRDGDVCTLCLGSRTRVSAVTNSCYHGSAVYSGGMAASLAVHHLIGTFAKRVSAFLALTPFMARMLAADGIPRGNIHVHPNFLEDPGDHRGGLDGYVFSGRLVPEKGVESMLEAWRLLGVDAPSLTVMGEGPMQDDVLALSGELPQVRYLGRLSNDEVVTQVRAAKCLLFPSLWFEGLGLTWLEALAVGTPIIYSDVGNFTEILDGFDVGRRYRSGDPQALADAVRAFEQNDLGEWNRLSQNARKAYVANYGADAAVDRLIGFYTDVAEGGSSGL